MTKAIFAILAALILLSVVAAESRQQTEDTAEDKEDDSAKDDKRLTENQGTNALKQARQAPVHAARQQIQEKSMEKCRDYLEGKDEDPEGTCQRLMSREENCVEYMQGKGIEEPKAECSKLLMAGQAVRVQEKAQIVLKKREIAQEQLKKSKERFEQAKEKYEKASKDYESAILNFQQAKQKAKECKGGECRQADEESIAKAKPVAGNAAEMIIQHLEKIKAKVEGAEDIDKNRSNEIIQDIDQTISEIRQAMQKINASQTKQEIKQSAQEMRQLWQNAQHRERIHAAWTVHAKIWNIVQRSQKLGERLNSTIERMQAEGKDTSQVQQKITEFNSRLAQADIKYKESTELLEQAYKKAQKNMTEEQRLEVKSLISQAQGLLRKAHEELKEAHQTLVEIAKELRQQGTTIDEE